MFQFFVFSSYSSATGSFCTKNGTRIVDGECVCLPGFVGFNPVGYGCWTCKNKCHINARCVNPGKCECRYGYHGDGETLCTNERPEIVAIEPNFGTADGGYEVNITLKKKIPNQNHSSFCRFGFEIVRGVSISANVLQCTAPPSRGESFVNVIVSFDQKRWSKNSFVFYYSTQTPAEKSKKRYSIITIPALLIIIASFILKSKKKNQEILPLIKTRSHLD